MQPATSVIVYAYMVTLIVNTERNQDQTRKFTSHQQRRLVARAVVIISQGQLPALAGTLRHAQGGGLGDGKIKTGNQNQLH